MKVTWLDESFGHQIVAPRTTTIHEDPTWAERCYYLLFAGDDLTLNTGRAVYPFDGRRTAFVGVATGREILALRAAEPFDPGDDPDHPETGPIGIEVIRPLEEVRLKLKDPGGPLAVDLTFTSRLPPVATEPNRIEQDERVVTDYMNFFQSGWYSGTVVIDDQTHQIDRRPGFRDRGWGIRKHEGSPRRGLVVFCGCELPDRSIYALFYERASGRRVFTNGWLIDSDGVVERVVDLAHDLTFKGQLLQDGVLNLTFGSGRRSQLRFEARNRLFMRTIGYSADPEERAPGRTRHDLTDTETVARLLGQTDNGCVFDFDGEPGHGYVETGLGVHARYRPNGEGS